MATKHDDRTADPDDGKYEFRVWGDYPKACRKLKRMASQASSEEFDDCYLIFSDLRWNAKVRDSTLKVKRLVTTDRGFDRWDSNWHTEAETAPSPFDDVFEDLALDRPQRGKRFDLPTAVAELDGKDAPTPVFVTKHRERYRIGSIRAEVVCVDIHGSDLHLKSLAIEGDDLTELVALRRELGLKGEDNVAMHVALADSTLACSGGT